MKPWVSKLAIIVIYLIILTFFRGKTDWFLVIGGIIGIYLIDPLDRLAFAFATEPELESSKNFRQNLKRFNLKPLIQSWPDYENAKERTLHNIVFQILLYVLTFYAVSTAVNPFIIGILLSMLLHLWLEQYQDFKKFGSMQHWFFLTGIEPTTNQATAYLVASGSIFALLTWQFGGY